MPAPTRSRCSRIPWIQWRRDVLDRLDISAVYGDILTGKRQSAAWLEARDPRSPSGDAHPSAGVADSWNGGERARFHSFLDDRDYSVFDYLTDVARVCNDFAAAREHVARLTGIPVPTVADSPATPAPVDPAAADDPATFAAHYGYDSFEPWTRQGWTIERGVIVYPIMSPDPAARLVLKKKIARDAKGKRRAWFDPKGSGEVGFIGSLDNAAGKWLVYAGGPEKTLPALDLGFSSISHMGGEKKPTAWIIDQVKATAPAGVICSFDNDEPGRIGNQESARAFHTAGVPVRVIQWPADRPLKWDLNDEFRDHGADAVRSLLDNAAPWSPPNWWILSTTRTGTLYESDDAGNIVRIVQKAQNVFENARVAECVVRIAEERSRQDLDDVAANTLLLEVRARTRFFSVEVPAREWLADREFKAHLAAAIPGVVIDGRGGLDAVRNLASEIRAAHPPRQVTAYPPGFDLKHDRYLTPTLHVTPEAFIPPPQGSGDICMNGWGDRGRLSLTDPDPAQAADLARVIAQHWPALFADPVEAATALAAGLTGSLVPPLLGGPPNIILALVGTTGSGKTTLLRRLAAFWGVPSLATAAQHATWKGALATAQNFRHALATIDDLRSGEQIAELVSLLYDGGSRAALNRAGALRNTPPIECATVLTAETLAGAGQSTWNRLVQIPLEPHPSADLPRIRAAVSALASHDDDAPGLTAHVIRHFLGVWRAYGRKGLRQQEDTYRATAAELGNASPRGHDLAARIAFGADHIEQVLYELTGEPVAWWPNSRDILAAIVARHAETERQANPAMVFLDALHQSMAAGDAFAVEHAHWKPGASTTIVLPTDRKTLRPGQVRIYHIAGVPPDDDTLAILPRPTLQTLRLDLSEGVIRQSLENNGLTRHTGASVGARIQLRVIGLMGQQYDRIAAWLVRIPKDT